MASDQKLKTLLASQVVALLNHEIAVHGDRKIQIDVGAVGHTDFYIVTNNDKVRPEGLCTHLIVRQPTNQLIWRTK